MVVVGGQSGGDTKMGQQFARMAGVFRRNQVGLFQDTQGAVGNILKIADRGSDDVQDAGHAYCNPAI